MPKGLCLHGVAGCLTVCRGAAMRGKPKKRAMAVGPIGFVHEGMLEFTRERKHSSDGRGNPPGLSGTGGAVTIKMRRRRFLSGASPDHRGTRIMGVIEWGPCGDRINS